MSYFGKIPYGTWVSITSTMPILGDTIYNTPSSANIRSENIAELHARVVEMNTAYQTGLCAISSNLDLWPLADTYGDWFPATPSFPYDTWISDYQGRGPYDQLQTWLGIALTSAISGQHNFSSHRSWDTIYTKSLLPAKKYVTDDPTGSTKIWWTEEDFVDGDILAFANKDSNPVYASLVNITTAYGDVYYDRTYSLDTPLTGVCTDFTTTNTRISTEDVSFRPGISPSSYPLASLMYPDDILSANANIFDDVGNWWTHKGLGTVVYAFSCEQYSNENGDDINVNSAGGVFWDASPSSTFIPFSGIGSVDFTNTRGNSDSYETELYKFTALGRQPAWVLCTSYATPLSCEFDRDYGQISEGDGNQEICKIRMISQPPIATNYPVRVAIETPTTIASINTTQINFNQTNWNTWQSISATPYNLGGAPRGASIRFNDQGNFAVGIQHFPVRITSSSQGEILTDPVYAVGTGTTENVTITLSGYPDAINWQDQRMINGTLKNGASALVDLNKTIAWVPNSEISYLSGSQIEYQTTYNSTSTFLSSIPTFPTATEVYDYLHDNTTITSSSTSVSSTFNGIPLEQRVYGYRSLFTRDSYQLRYDAYYSGNLEITTNEWTKCKLPYPSEWACNNGYVNKISVYAVVEGLPPQPANSTGAIFIVTPNTDAERTSVGYNFQLSDQDDITFGLFNNLSTHFDKSGGMIFDGINSYDYDSDLEDSFSEYKLSLINEYNDPSTLPEFDIGSDQIIKAAYSDIQKSIGTNVWYNSAIPAEFTDEYERFNLYQKLNIRGFVVVVDWEFEHLNDFTPSTTNEPLWMTSAFNYISA